MKNHADGQILLLKTKSKFLGKKVGLGSLVFQTVKRSINWNPAKWFLYDGPVELVPFKIDER